MPSYRSWKSLSLLVLPGLAALASGAAPAAETLPAAARDAIERLLKKETAGLPGRVGIELKGGGALPPCDDYEAFLPQGSAPRGRLSIGLRCRSGQPWTRFVPAQVTVEGRYYVAARAIEAGETLAAGDVEERSGDLGALPRSVLTDAAALRGVVAASRIAAGAPLRKESLRGRIVIEQGQAVQLVAQGRGFTVSTEGRALTRAEVGATVQARTRDGRLLTGVAAEDGQVRLSQ